MLEIGHSGIEENCISKSVGVAMGHVRIPENRIAKSSGVDRGAHWIFQKGDFQKSVWVKIGYIRIAEKVNLQIWFGGIWARRMSERIRNRTIFPKFL